MEVHRHLGHGFLEAVYQEALLREFRARQIPVDTEVRLTINYKGEALKHTYRADVLCYDKVLVEIKALSRLTTVEQSQVINYLKATGLERGLLLNFGRPSLEYRRLVFSQVARATK